MSLTRGTEIDYQIAPVASGKYTYSRVLPQTSMPMTLQPSSVSEVITEVPNRVWNPSKSSLEFSVAYPSVALSAVRLHSVGLTMIDQITLESREGASIARLANCAQYSRATACAFTKLAEFLTNESNLGNTALNQVQDFGHNLWRSNATAMLSAGGINGVSNTDTVATARGAPLSASFRISALDEAEASLAYTEPQYLTSGLVGAAYSRKYRIPLSAFHGTALAMDKDMFFNQNLLMKINFAPTNVHGFTSTVGDISTTGTVVPIAACTVSNFRFLQAVEVEPQIVASIVNQVQSSGMNLVIPYVHSYVQSTAPSTTDIQVTQRFTRAHGERLLHVASVLYSSAATGRDCFDLDNNVPNQKISSFQSRLDNNNLTEFRPECSNGDDYNLMKSRLDKSVAQDRSVWNYNRAWIDSWRRGRTCEYSENDSDQQIEGVNLDEERLYDINLTTASGAYRHYLFACCQRMLSIAPTGIVQVI